MNKSIAAAFIGAVLALLLATGAYAAEDMKSGKYSLDVNIPTSGSTTVGGRLFTSSDMAIEVFTDTQIKGKDNLATEAGEVGSEGGMKVSVGGGIMQYLSEGRVTPFMRAGGMLNLYFGDRYDALDNDINGYAGVGVEFKVTKEFTMRTSVNAILGIDPFILGTQTNTLQLSFIF